MAVNVYEYYEIDVMALMKTLWRKKWIILSSSFFGGALALACVELRSPSYASVSSLDIGCIYRPADGEGIGKLSLLDSPETVKSFLTNDLVLSGLAREIEYKRALKTLKKAIKITDNLRDDKGFPELLITISFQSVDPDKAKKGNEYLSNALLDYHASELDQSLPILDQTIQLVDKKIQAGQLEIQYLKSGIKTGEDQISKGQKSYSLLEVRSGHISTGSKQSASNKSEKKNRSPSKHPELDREMGVVPTRKVDHEKTLAEKTFNISKIEVENEILHLDSIRLLQMKKLMRKTTIKATCQIQKVQSELSGALAIFCGCLAGFLVGNLWVFLIMGIKELSGFSPE